MKDDFYNGFLVTPLNWGLGHASRCVPIIQYLIEKEIRIVVASDGEALLYLKKEFPQLTFEELPSYGVKYTEGSNFLQNILKQLPKFIKAIHEENHVVDTLIQKHNISKIISDNRYGCYNKDTKNILITHQLCPNLKGWWRSLNWPIEQILRLQYDNFNMVWIPDDEINNLSGILSSLPIADKQFIGVLSRFINIKETVLKNEILVILSGVEPQRTILEAKIIDQLKSINKNAVIVSGIGEGDEMENISTNITKYQRLSTNALAHLISESKYIVCRAGYSSIMDLAVLGKKALLIPTPGQIEQEYLAEKLMKEKKFLMQTQENLNLAEAINEIDKYEGIKLGNDEINLFKNLVDKLID